MQTSLFGPQPSPSPASTDDEDEAPPPEPASRRRLTPEERAFGNHGWLWIPGPQLAVHWSTEHGYQLPDGTPWKAPRRLEPPWWKPLTEAPAALAFAAVTATVDRRCRYYHDNRSVTISGSDQEDAPDGGRFGHWSAHLRTTGWATLAGQRVLVLDALSIDTAGTKMGSGASLVRYSDGGPAQVAWGTPTSLHDTLQNAGSWQDITAELQFLQEPPVIPAYPAEATAAWQRLRAANPGFTADGGEDATWRIHYVAGAVRLVHKATGRAVAVGAPHAGLHDDPHGFVGSLVYEACKTPDPGPHLHLHHAAPTTVDLFLDRLEGCLEWCRNPTPDVWKLIGVRLRPDYGYNVDAWERALDLVRDLEKLDPPTGTPLATSLDRARGLIAGAAWNLPGILAARDERILRHAAALKPKRKSSRRAKTESLGDEEE